MPTRHTITNFLLITLALTITTTAHATDTIRYVNKSNTNPTQDGLTWQTAFTTIQPAIDAAHDAGGGEVWVAAGVYDEIRSSVDPETMIDSGSLEMREDVEMYGGFLGGETNRNDRKLSTNTTIIDGSESRDGQRAYNVIVNSASGITIDGFTIQRGGDENNDTSRGGGGLSNSGANLSVVDCIFRENLARFRGGALNSQADGTTIIGCDFVDNSTRPGGGSGGGVSIYGGSATLEGCTFARNVASGTGGLILEVSDEISSVVRNCVFDSNEMTGGAFSSAGGASVTGSVLFENCLFVNNISVGSDNGGAMFYSGTINSLDNRVGNGVLLNCTFVGNSAQFGSAAMFSNLKAYVRNCVFWDNENSWVVVRENVGSSILVTNCLIQDGAGVEPPQGVFDANINEAPQFVNPAAGDYRLRPQSSAIDNGNASSIFDFQIDVTYEMPDTDLDGKARPLGDGFDIGAYEFDPEVPFEDPFDATGDSSVNAADIQHIINQVLGTTSPITDINNDGTTNATDIQLIINRVLGMI